MLKFVKALVIGYTVLWGVEQIKTRRESNPARRVRPSDPTKRLRPRRPQNR